MKQRLYHTGLYAQLFNWKFQINECITPGIAKDSQWNLSAHDTTKVLSYLGSFSLNTEAKSFVASSSNFYLNN